MLQFIRNRRPSVKGLIIGVLIGLAVSVAYGATAGWLCSGIRKCPASWEPFAIVSSIIFVLITVGSIGVAVVVAKLYRVFDTSLVIRDDGESSYSEVVRTTYPEPSKTDG
jgi:ABC-type uncharacterized transport system permease subunit